MTDNFSPDNLGVPDDQLGLWDTPPDLSDEPPDDEWIPPTPPEDWIPPTPPDAEPADTTNAPVDPIAATSEAPAADKPFAEPLAPQAALPDESGYMPFNTWERYLASFTPDKNPDILDSEQRSRGQELNLMDARFVGVEYQNEAGEPTGYGVGSIEVYADPTQADGISASYLEIAAFDNPLDAAALYDTLQTPVEKGWIADYS